MSLSRRHFLQVIKFKEKQHSVFFVTFMICVHKKFLKFIVYVSLVTNIKPKSTRKYRFRAVAVLINILKRP